MNLDSGPTCASLRNTLRDIGRHVGPALPIRVASRADSVEDYPLRVRVVPSRGGWTVEVYSGYHRTWVEEKNFDSESSANRYANKLRSDKIREENEDDYDRGYN